MRQRAREAARRELEERLVPFAVAGDGLARVEGWARTMRRAMGVSATEMAGRLGTTRRAVHRLEAVEAAGRLELDRLRALAEALGCELHYALRPTAGLKELAEEGQRLRIEALRRRRRDTRDGVEVLRDEARKVLRKLLGEDLSEFIRSLSAG